MSDVPSQRRIDQMIAGTAAGSSYQQARHQVWSAIRRASERGLDVSEAVEAAQALDRNVAAQQGSALDIAYLRDLAISAVAAAGPVV